MKPISNTERTSLTKAAEVMSVFERELEPVIPTTKFEKGCFDCQHAQLSLGKSGPYYTVQIYGSLNDGADMTTSPLVSFLLNFGDTYWLKQKDDHWWRDYVQNVPNAISFMKGAWAKRATLLTGENRTPFVRISHTSATGFVHRNRKLDLEEFLLEEHNQFYVSFVGQGSRHGVYYHLNKNMVRNPNMVIGDFFAKDQSSYRNLAARISPPDLMNGRLLPIVSAKKEAAMKQQTEKLINAAQGASQPGISSITDNIFTTDTLIAATTNAWQPSDTNDFIADDNEDWDD